LWTGVTSKAQMFKLVNATKGLREAKSALEATHVVTDLKLKRTPKLLAAIAVAKHVVSVDWLKASAKQGRPYKNARDFAVKDSAAEANWGFDLRESLESRAKILTGYAVALAPGVRDNKKMPADDEIHTIVEAAGGLFLDRLPSSDDQRHKRHNWPPERGLLVVADRAKVERGAAHLRGDDLDTPEGTKTLSNAASTSSKRTARRIAGRPRSSLEDAETTVRALRALPRGLLTGIIEPENLWCALLRKHLDLAKDVLPGDGVFHDIQMAP